MGFFFSRTKRDESLIMKKKAVELLVERGLADSREKAEALIMSGVVLAGTKRVDKAGEMLCPETQFRIKDKGFPWVSRAGLKLVKGLDEFKINPEGCVCLDIGCSTGGFTDVLLSRGAKKVYAVDVGYGQLAFKLREDPRVVVLERMNARHLTNDQILEPVDLIVCDASFIRLEKVLQNPLKFAKTKGAYLVALIKPQFEVEKYQVGKNGVVDDPRLHECICEKIKKWLNSLPGWSVKGVCQSPIKGAEGNIEFLIAADFFIS